MPVIKKIPKKSKMSQKQKQRQSVNQTVVVNQQPAIRRRGPNKPKAPSGGSGGPSQGYSQGPTIQYSPYQISNPAPGQQPPEPRAQPVINILNELPDSFNENVRYYRSPFRLQPFKENMNQNNLKPDEVPLNNFQPAPPPPNPEPTPIVQQPNYIHQGSVSSATLEINPNSTQPNYLHQGSVSSATLEIHPNNTQPVGFTSNTPVNQLNATLNAFKDYGGDDAQSVNSGAISPLTPSTPLSRVEKAYSNLKQSLGLPQAIEIPSAQSMSVAEVIQDNPVLLRKPSNRGRPFSEVTPDDFNAIEYYLEIKNDKKMPNYIKEAYDKEHYKRGRILVGQGKGRNPDVIAFVDAVNKRLLK
jgi:hypothetical protein